MRTILFLLLFAGCGLTAAAQSEASEAARLEAMRSAFINQANGYRGVPLADHASAGDVPDRNYFALQLSVAQPGYIPFTVYPHGSPLAGHFTEGWMGGTPMHVGGNIYVYPGNDPLRGYGRVAAGLGMGMLGGMYNGGYMPFGNSMGMGNFSRFGGYGMPGFLGGW